jgi:hypothetical protein
MLCYAQTVFTFWTTYVCVCVWHIRPKQELWSHNSKLLLAEARKQQRYVFCAVRADDCARNNGIRYAIRHIWQGEARHRKHKRLRGLNLAAVMRTTVQASRLLL